MSLLQLVDILEVPETRRKTIKSRKVKFWHFSLLTIKTRANTALTHGPTLWCLDILTSTVLCLYNMADMSVLVCLFKTLIHPPTLWRHGHGLTSVEAMAKM